MYSIIYKKRPNADLDDPMLPVSENDSEADAEMGSSTEEAQKFVKMVVLDGIVMGPMVKK